MNEEEDALVDLQPASYGNTELSKGGLLLDSSVEDKTKYTYRIYKYQRDGINIDKTYSKDQDPNKVFAEDGSIDASLTIPVDTTNLGAVTIPNAAASTPANSGKCIGLGIPIPSFTKGTTVTCAQGYAEYIKYLFEFSLGIGVLLATLMVIYSGIIMITSQGNPTITKDAKDRLINALMGLAFLLLAGLITKVLSL